jgi:hypothetical protein
MARRRISELPPPKPFRESYRSQEIDGDNWIQAARSVVDEVYRLGTEFAALQAKEVEHKIDARLGREVWVVRDKERFIYAICSTEADARDVANFSPLITHKVDKLYLRGFKE